MTGRIILIGMPAGGKTTIGAALSRALGLDHEAELARQRVAERRRRLDDLPQQAGGAAVHRDGNTLRHRHRRWCGVDGAEP